MINQPDERATPENDKGAAPDQENAPSETTQQQTDSKLIGSRSTSTETQIGKLIALLRQGPKTTHSLRMHGISHPAGRIKDLRDSEYVIYKETVKAIDSDGFTHINVARYALIQEPPKPPALVVGREVRP